MPSHDLDAALERFSQLQDTQLQVWAGELRPEVSWLDNVKAKAVLRPFFVDPPGDMIDLLNRPRSADDSWYAEQGARKVGARTVFGVQAATIGGESVALIYTDQFIKTGDLDGQLTRRFVLAEVDGALKVVAKQVACGDCGGAGCPFCADLGGWRHARGRPLTGAIASGPVRVLAPLPAGTPAALGAALR